MNGRLIIEYIRESNCIRIKGDGDLKDRTVSCNVLLSHLEQLLVEAGINPADYYRALHNDNHPDITSGKEDACFFNPIRDGMGDGELIFWVTELGTVRASASGSAKNESCRIQMILDVIRSFLINSGASWKYFWSELEMEERSKYQKNRLPLLGKISFKRKHPN